MPRKTPLVDKISAEILADAHTRIQTSQALPFARITSVKLTPAARDQLVQQLVALGLERTAKMLRQPLAMQIEMLVQRGARVARKDLAKRVKGATKMEIDATLAKLIRDKRIHLVVRTQTEIIVGPDERILSLTETHQLVKAITTLAKTVKKVQSKGLPKTLLREDLDAVLGLSAPLSKSVVPNLREESAEGLVIESLRQLENPTVKLVRIADLVRTLEPRLSKVDVHRVLIRAFDDGTIELRPDGGTEFLKPEDALLCIPGPRGTVFSYARRMSP